MKKSDSKRILKAFLAGDSYSEIADKIGEKGELGVQRVKDCVMMYEASVEEQNKLMPKDKALWFLLREQAKILELKDNIIDYCRDAVSADISKEEKLKSVDKIAKLMTVLDTIHKTNANMPSQIVETREVKLDVAEIMKNLDTPEKKKAFLLRGFKQPGQQVDKSDYVM